MPTLFPNLTEDEFYEIMLAEHEGRAMRLIRCYLCHLEQTGQPDWSPKADQGPLRGISRSYTGGGSDPTEVYVLVPCNHHVI